MTPPRMQDKRFRQMLDAAPDAMVIVDQRGSMVAVNREAERLFGWTDAELRGESSSRLIPQRFQQVYEALGVSDGKSPEIPPKRAPVRIFARRRDGSEFPVEIHRSPLGPSEDVLFLLTIRDLTEWRDVQESLFRQKEQAIVTLASIADAVITTDVAGRITFLNPTAERLLGWRTTEALGQPVDTVLTLISDATRQPMESISARCLREGRAVDLADGVLLLRRDGTEVPIGGSAAPLRDRHGATTEVVLVLHDVTERRRAARKLSHEATHDALTGFVGRKEFEDRLARVLAEAAAGVVEHALCYLDLDRFKLVNDTCGHEAGDDLLRRISQLLSSRLCSRDTLARLGGDEFGVLLEYCSLTKAAEIAGKLERAIEEFRCVWGERSFSLGVSIGVVAITAASGRTADVLRAADEACASPERWTRATFSCTRKRSYPWRRSTRHVRGARFCCACRTSMGVWRPPTPSSRKRSAIASCRPSTAGSCARRSPSSVSGIATTRSSSYPSARSTSAFPHWTMRT